METSISIRRQISSLIFGLGHEKDGLDRTVASPSLYSSPYFFFFFISQESFSMAIKFIQSLYASITDYNMSKFGVKL